MSSRTDPLALAWYRCEPCDRLTFRSKAIAKKAAKTATPSGGRLSPYPCPHGEDLWHIGHLPSVVRHGVTDRRALHSRNAT